MLLVVMGRRRHRRRGRRQAERGRRRVAEGGRQRGIRIRIRMLGAPMLGWRAMCRLTAAAAAARS
jgi:hypothetical protein